MNKIGSVLVAGSENLFQHGLCAVVNGAPGLSLVGTVSAARNGGHWLRAALGTQPAVALVDLHELRADQLLSVVQTCALAPLVRYVFVALETQRVLCQSLMPPHATVVPPSIAPEHLALTLVAPAQALEQMAAARAAEGVPEASPEQDELDGKPLGEPLTPRERQILMLLAAGHSNARMALSLGVAVPTVKFHIGNLLRKLGAVSRTQAVVRAYRWRLVEPMTASH